MNEPYAKTDKYDDGGNLEQDHHVIRFSRFANPAHKNNSEQHDDQKRRPIEAEMPPGRIKFIAGKIAHAAREVRGGNPSRVRMHAKPVKQADNMRGKSNAHGHVTDGIFEYEVPTNDPGDEFAHGGVRVRVGAAGDRNHRGEFGVTQRGEPADNRHQHERYGNRGARARPSERRRPVNQIFKQGSVQDGRDLQLLSSDGGPDNGKNSGTDDGPNAEGGEAQPPERFFQSAFRLIRIGD